MAIQIRFAALLVAFTVSGCTSTAGHNSASNAGKATDSTCLTTTGSRIPAANDSCTAVGRSYSRNEIDQTGATSAAAALQQLDPSVTAHR